MTDPTPLPPVAPVSPAAVTKTTLVNELLVAFDRAFLAALGAFTGTMSLTTGNDTKALVAAGISAGTAALVSLGRSVQTLNS